MNHESFFFKDLAADYHRWVATWGKGGALVFCRLVLLEPGFQVMISCRLQRALAKVPLVGKLLRRLLWYFTAVLWGADIDPQATIEGGIFMPHPNGIVVGGGSYISAGVSLLPSVTLGRTVGEAGPFIGNGVVIGAGARVLGGVRIGANAKIGANSVVLADVPEGSTAVGVPARIAKGRS